MTREYMPVRVEWKAADDDSNVLEGYASVFDVTDLHGDIVKRGAFRKTIKERIKAGRVKLLDSHVPDSSHVIGTVTEAKEDETGLRIRARLSSAPSVQDLKVKLLEGHLEYLSIGYSTVKESWHRVKDEMVRHLEELKLYEVSVVPFPANEEAAISAVKEAIRVAGSGLVEAPAEERKQLAEDLSDTLVKVFEEPVTLIVGKSADEVKSALGRPGDDPDDPEDTGPDEVDTKDSADEAEQEGTPDEPKAEKPSLKEIMRRATAMLEDRDPNEVAEPTQVASLTTRLDIEERLLRDLIPEQDQEAS